MHGHTLTFQLSEAEVAQAEPLLPCAVVHKFGTLPPSNLLLIDRAETQGEHLLCSILITQANDTVRPIHEQAMPVILTTPEECETWMTAPAYEALTLQRSLPNDALKIVASGEKEDKAI